MKISLTLIILFTLQNNLSAQDSTKKMYAVKAVQFPRIDGDLSDEVWKNAVPVSDFIQSQPIEGAIPTQRTEVRIAYDNVAIYVGAMLYDTAPDSILKELGNRDDELNADFFRFVIDPYNTRQDAFDFGVYASGVQLDKKFSDETFDAVWQSAVKITDNGWVVEMKIPYSAIRFPKKDIQEWGLQFTRSIRRNREFDQWALTPSEEANPLRFWGTLHGINNIQTPLRLSFTPYISAYAERAPDLNDNDIYANSLSYHFGADVKYGIDDRFTLDMTLLPDFGQVQSDNKVKNLSYREINYDENRPFFKEGVELFDKDQLFYSRRIGKVPTGFFSVPSLLDSTETLESNPSQVKLLNATKLSGRTNNGLGIGFFNAVTDDAYAIIKDSLRQERKLLTEPLTNYNVVVFDQQLKNNSSVYFINTNVIRAKNYDDANVSGAGLTLNNKASTYAIDVTGAVSQKFTRIDASAPIFENTIGYKYFLGARKISGKFQYGISRYIINNTFDPHDFGYYTLNNLINNRVYFQYNLYQPKGIFRNSFNTFSVDYGTNFLTGKRNNLAFNYNTFTTFLNYLSVFAGTGFSPLESYDYYEPRAADRYYLVPSYYFGYFGISTDYRKKIAVDMSINHANFIERYRKAGFGGEVNLRYRVSDKFTIRTEYEYNYDPFNIGFVDFENAEIVFGGRKLITHENELSAKYIFMPDMSLSLDVRKYWNTGDYKRYFYLRHDGYLDENNNVYLNNFSYNIFNIDLVYSWQFAPGSLLSLVYKNFIESEDSQIYPYIKNFTRTFESPQVNSLSLRLLYYLDYGNVRRK